MKKRKILYQLLFMVVVTILVMLYFILHKEEDIPIQISSFYVINRIDSTMYERSMRPFSREDNFLVVGFQSYEKNIAEIDRFICSKSMEIDSIIKKYSNYHINFFKKTKITNNNYIEENESEWGWDGNSIDKDLICTYSWLGVYFINRCDPDDKYVLDTLLCQ